MPTAGGTLLVGEGIETVLSRVTAVPEITAVLNNLPRKGRFVFPNAKGDGPMTDRSLRWQRLRALAGVRIHDGRHTFASHAVMRLDLYTVGRLVGHADPTPPNAMPTPPTSTSERRRSVSAGSSTGP